MDQQKKNANQKAARQQAGGAANTQYETATEFGQAGNGAVAGTPGTQGANANTSAAANAGAANAGAANTQYETASEFGTQEQAANAAAAQQAKKRAAERMQKSNSNT